MCRYVNGSDNDLEYWGLDYPPLTAYHSWLLGAMFVCHLLTQTFTRTHCMIGIQAAESGKVIIFKANVEFKSLTFLSSKHTKTTLQILK